MERKINQCSAHETKNRTDKGFEREMLFDRFTTNTPKEIYMSIIIFTFSPMTNDIIAEAVMNFGQ